VSRPDVDVAGEDDLTVVVTFSPEEAGDFEGEIVFTTNDPTHPTVTVALEGVGVDEEDTDPDTDPDDTGDEDGRRGCGCAVDSSAPVGALGMLPIALLIARRRRR
jgi:MYXO-CTERM domain-containing protein